MCLYITAFLFGPDCTSNYVEIFDVQSGENAQEAWRARYCGNVSCYTSLLSIYLYIQIHSDWFDINPGFFFLCFFLFWFNVHCDYKISFSSFFKSLLHSWIITFQTLYYTKNFFLILNLKKRLTISFKKLISPLRLASNMNQFEENQFD